MNEDQRGALIQDRTNPSPWQCCLNVEIPKLKRHDRSNPTDLHTRPDVEVLGMAVLWYLWRSWVGFETRSTREPREDHATRSQSDPIDGHSSTWHLRSIPPSAKTLGAEARTTSHRGQTCQGRTIGESFPAMTTEWSTENRNGGIQKCRLSSL